MNSMKIHQLFFKNTLRNFCYLIVFDDGAIYCIDPFRASEVLDFLGIDKKLTAIINTHDHCDHYSGNEELLKDSLCPVYAHAEANIPGKTFGLQDGEILYQNDPWDLVAVDTPGHTMSHMCLMIKKEGIPYALFTGDCFFNAGVGNCHKGGSLEAMYKTISETFSQFPDELLIYPGHEYLKRNLEFTMNIESDNSDAENFLKKIESVDMNEIFFVNTMLIERKINMFLRLEKPSIKKHLNLVSSDDKTVFFKLRELRNTW